MLTIYSVALSSSFFFPAFETPSQTSLRQLPAEFDSSAVISSLYLRVTTKNKRGAGTDNAIYFDIGPLAWKLGKPHHNDFERGRTDTYTLEIPKGVILKKEDILWLRLHKKGIGGVTGTRDGLDGAWHPERITLVVNGQDYKTLAVDTLLNSRCWFWRSADPQDADLEIFARSLRMQPNKGLNTLDKVLGLLTTPLFKRTGISGWLRNPAQRECAGTPPKRKAASSLPPACATGEVIYVGSSTDGLETIDLKVTRIEWVPNTNNSQPQVVFIDAEHGFDQSRYLRIENRHAHNRAKKGQLDVRICGNVRWDTDREGWWEIHPRNSGDLPPASR